MNRRGFLTTAAGMSTYSLMVFAGEPEEVSRPPIPATNTNSTAFSEADQLDRRFDGEPHMALVDLECDLLVAGGGPSGVCAALAAARNGATVVLVQNRSRLGGNSSSEVKMHIVGANMHRGRPGWREGGIIEELRLDDASGNPQRCWEQWDLLLYDKIISEPNCALLLDTTLYAADVNDGSIRRVMARCDPTETLYRINAACFADCTGDGRLALEAGATIRWGHEARSEFDESLAWEEAGPETLGSSILFTARDYGHPMPYRPPAWSRKIEKKHLQFRGIGSWEYGYWWIEWGGQMDTIRDNERIRSELLAIVTGVWDYIKNSGEFPDTENWAMDWVGMIPGKRESRRIEGDYMLTQHDLEGKKEPFDDAVGIGGWGLDEHPPGGFDDFKNRPFVSIPLPEVYNIPYRSLYSKDISNLFIAGRHASCSHVAFTSTRVMATCAVMGQAVGTAAALCTRYELTPRQLYKNKQRLEKLQQTLLRDDQTIKSLKNEDPLDLARQAGITSSRVLAPSVPEKVTDGFVRDMEGEMNHRWVAPMTDEGAWITLSWSEPQQISTIQITFDTGFHRELTLSSADHVNQHVIRGPQPETVRDYTVHVFQPDGCKIQVVEITGNYQRIRRHHFDSVLADTVRIEIQATNGSPEARIYEVRCYR